MYTNNTNMCIYSKDFATVFNESMDPPDLADEWLTDSELEHKRPFAIANIDSTVANLPGSAHQGTQGKSFLQRSSARSCSNPKNKGASESSKGDTDQN